MLAINYFVKLFQLRAQSDSWKQVFERTARHKDLKHFEWKNWGNAHNASDTEKLKDAGEKIKNWFKSEFEKKKLETKILNYEN